MITVENNQLVVAGSITYDNAAELLEQGCTLLKQGSIKTIDLSAIEKADSTAISLLLAWRGTAQQQNNSLEFKNYPANLKNLAELYGVFELLGNQQEGEKPPLA